MSVAARSARGPLAAKCESEARGPYTNAKLNAGFLRKSFCLREGPRRRSTRSVTSRLRVPASIAGPRKWFAHSRSAHWASRTADGCRDTGLVDERGRAVDHYAFAQRAAVRRRRVPFGVRAGAGWLSGMPVSALMRDHTGCGTIRMYGLGSFQSPKIPRASLSGTEPAMMTS